MLALGTRISVCMVLLYLCCLELCLPARAGDGRVQAALAEISAALEAQADLDLEASGPIFADVTSGPNAFDNTV